jgi:hypothetical protein
MQKSARLMTPTEDEDMVDWSEDSPEPVPSETVSPETVSSEADNDQYKHGNSLSTASYNNIPPDSQDSSKELLQAIFETRPNLLPELGLVNLGDSVVTSLFVSGRTVQIKIHVIDNTNTNITYQDNGETLSTEVVEMSQQLTDRDVGVNKFPRKRCAFVNTPNGCRKGDDCRYSHPHQVRWCTARQRQACPVGFNCALKHDDDNNWNYWNYRRNTYRDVRRPRYTGRR